MGSFAFRPEELPPGPFAAGASPPAVVEPRGTALAAAPASEPPAGERDPDAVLAAAEPWIDRPASLDRVASCVAGLLSSIGVVPPIQPRNQLPEPAPAGLGSEALFAGDDEELRARLGEADLALAGRFEIVDEEMRYHAPNQITQEEYDGLVRMYADIAHGDSDLLLPEAIAPRENELEVTTQMRLERDDLRARMLNDIASILQTDNGRALIGQLHDNYLKDEDGRALDPETGLPLAEGIAPAHHTTRLFESLVADDSAAYIDIPGHVGDPRKDPVLSAQIDEGLEQGEMFNTLVGWKPGQDFQGIRSDVALFHELRHAYDYTTGNLDPGLVVPGEGPPIDVANAVEVAESQAVGLGQTHGAGMNGGPAPLSENAYRAERAAIGAALGVGIREGDIGMPQRPTYTI